MTGLDRELTVSTCSAFHWCLYIAPVVALQRAICTDHDILAACLRNEQKSRVPSFKYVGVNITFRLAFFTRDCESGISALKHLNIVMSVYQYFFRNFLTVVGEKILRLYSSFFVLCSCILSLISWGSCSTNSYKKLSYRRESAHVTSLYHTVQKAFRYVEPGPHSESRKRVSTVYRAVCR